jgi:hypothetical protein
MMFKNASESEVQYPLRRGANCQKTPSHDEHPLDDQQCWCGSFIMYRRRVIMGEHGGEMTFAAWCQKDPDHRLPEALVREIAELRSELGP